MTSSQREARHDLGIQQRPWVALVLAFVVAALWTGCAVTTSNYKALSFFFDGVPDPSLKVAGGASTGGQPSFVVQHRPFVEERCDECHKTKYRPSKNDSSICLQCHAAVKTQYSNMHAAVIANACLWCHNPHESAQPFLLRTADRKACAQCHTPSSLGSDHVPAHADEARGCLECHSGHGSNHPFLLRTPGPDATPETNPAATPEPAGGG